MRLFLINDTACERIFAVKNTLLTITILYIYLIL